VPPSSRKSTCRSLMPSANAICGRYTPSNHCSKACRSGIIEYCIGFGGPLHGPGDLGKRQQRVLTTPGYLIPINGDPGFTTTVMAPAALVRGANYPASDSLSVSGESPAWTCLSAAIMQHLRQISELRRRWRFERLDRALPAVLNQSPYNPKRAAFPRLGHCKKRSSQGGRSLSLVRLCGLHRGKS